MSGRIVTEAYGCTITTEKLGKDYFNVSVEYDSCSKSGEVIAHPVFSDTGTGADCFLFIVKAIARYRKNNTVVIDAGALELEA